MTVKYLYFLLKRENVQSVEKNSQTEDPTYITTYKNARAMIRKVDRDDLLQAMLRSYLNV